MTEHRKRQPRIAPGLGNPPPVLGLFPLLLLLFEEFGTEKLDPTAPPPTLTFPLPSTGPAPSQDPNNVARSGPEGSALEAFLKQPGLYPFPAQYSNVLDRNPWKAQIEAFLNRHSVGSPAEGRPPGKGWSHQRWNEFYPQATFKTAQAGARINQGLRDRRQLHNYAQGTMGWFRRLTRASPDAAVGGLHALLAAPGHPGRG